MQRHMLSLAIAIFVAASTFAFQELAQASPRSEQIKSAVEYLSACGNFIRFDDEYVYTGFGSYWTGTAPSRQPKPSLLRFVPVDRVSEYQVATSDAVVDVVKAGSSTYVLTYSGIEEWDLKQFKRLATYRTTNVDRALGDEEHAKAFALFENKLIIAHGRLGISIFDLTTKKVTKSFAVAVAQQPLESVVNGITVSGRYAFAVLDSYTLVSNHDKPAFRGLVVIDLETEKIVSELDGMDPAADSVVSDNQSLIVSFYGQPLLKYSLPALDIASELPAPRARISKFPIEGRQFGKAAMDDKYYYTCFARVPGPGEGSRYIKSAKVWDRQSLHLD